jgi:dihydrolipoamide dehydrogenase
MLVVGSGVIGLELGSVYSRLGTEVTVLGNMDRICPFLDSDLSIAFKKTLEQQGMKFILKTRVNAGRGSPNGSEIDIIYTDTNKTETLKSEVVLVAAGRRAFTGGL